MELELNHKKYNIYGSGNKSVKISNPKEVQILIDDEPNGATLNDVCRKIEDLGTNKIYAWSILEYYKVEDGFLVDNEGHKISLLQGEERIFFKSIEDPLFIENEKKVSLDYVRDVSSLLGLVTIEETIVGLSNEDKQILVEERMLANEKRQKQIQKEKEDADARERQRLEEERIKLEKEQAEEQERLDQLERERIEAEKQEKELELQKQKEKEEQEEKERIELENKKAMELEEKRKKKEKEEEEKRIEAENKRKQKEEQEERERVEAEIKKRKKEREENENVYTPEQYYELRKEYLKDGFIDYITSDGKYIFFYGEVGQISEKPFIILRTEEDYEELVGGELTVDNEKIAEYEFKDNGKNKVVTLNKKTDSIRVQVLV